MQHFTNEMLRADSIHGGFESVPLEIFRIDVPQTDRTRYSSYRETEFSGHDGAASRERLEGFLAGADRSTPTSPHDDSAGTLLCMFHRSRPAHASGIPDKLPFADSESASYLFEFLDLPTSYLQLADGSLSLVHSSIVQNHSASDDGDRFELVAYCVTKQGDWSMALTHRRATKHTSVFCSIDQRMAPERLIERMRQLQDLACHPLLLPYILFEAVLHAGLERRSTIKNHLRILERGVQKADRTISSSAVDPTDEFDSQQASNDLVHLFDRLHSCRRVQASREGRYELWRSFHEAMVQGFEYSMDIAVESPSNGKFASAETALRQWFELTSTKFESLKARDKDHVERINNLSDVLYNIVHLRDSRVQLDTALATKRDSEDMKFIALLGAIFLPASLIASILNVQEFQFLPGGKLFGIYVAITIPLAGLLVTLFLARPMWRRWYRSWWRRKKDDS